jgi:hypothetical protein
MSGWTCPLGLLPWAKATAANSQFPVSKCTGRGHGRRSPPPEPSQNPRGPLQAGLSLNMTSSRDARGTKSSIPRKMPQPQAWQKGRQRENQRVNSAPPRQSTIPRLPVPSLAQIQSSRSSHKGSDYGQARAAGRIRGRFKSSDPNAPGDVSLSLGLRVPVSAEDGPPPPSRS